MADKKLNYAEAIARIERILAEMETDTPDVDQLAERVREAVTLIDECRKTLRKAEEEISSVLNAEME